MIAGAPANIRTARGRASNLTHVELTWLEKRIEHWIRFGRIAEERVFTRHTRIVSFAPGSVFAFVWWASNDFGTIISRVDILCAVAQGEPYSTLPFVRPGGELLLRIVGWPNVSRVLSAIDQVEVVGIRKPLGEMILSFLGKTTGTHLLRSRVILSIDHLLLVR
jgi:hypothetical protein